MLQMACASRKLRDELEAQFSDIGLTANQAMVIHFTASKQGEVYPKNIETHFQITHPSVSRILRNMESKGYISMQPDPEDGRCRRVVLTALAQEKTEQIDARMICIDKLLAHVLTEKEKESLTNILRKLTS